MSLKLRVTAGNNRLGEIGLDHVPFWLRGRIFVNAEAVEIESAHHVADATTCKGWLFDDDKLVEQIELTLYVRCVGEGDTIAFSPGTLSINSCLA